LFCACDQYPACKTTFSVPSNALIKPTGETCRECQYPQVLVIRKGKRPWKYCINKECPVKEAWRKQQEEKKAKEEKEKATAE